MSEILVAALYRFTPFADPAALRGPLARACARAGITGTLLLAREGLNGTIAGAPEGIASVLAHLRGLPGCSGLEAKLSHADVMPFRRMKVRLKREIVTLGRPEADPTRAVGVYVPPSDWNALIGRPETVVIDTRNAYEVAIGGFEGAIDPGLKTFRDFPDWWRANRDAFEGRPVAMFCTGGIRCEKASSFLLAEGVREVYHLRGGILKYLEEVPEAASRWRGECFVFDGRVSVGHGLALGRHGRCHACGRPVSEADQAHADFEAEVACPACFGEYDETRRAGFRERRRQMEIARAKGIAHLGG
ncbi:MAG: rhodanese-related sulfurtransferase [Amaricoccus sp.]|uniref:oxygen-dependent tRNA uridine(34) hydroxylase TrhO n=1 Tax=Amaricoccus sp. TaxID=1872485 RepID=UPI0033153714